MFLQILYSSMTAMVAIVVVGFLVAMVGICLLKQYFKRVRKSQKRSQRSVAFFHPYCNAGGGGERVLWCAVQAIQSKTSSDCISCSSYFTEVCYPDLKISVYTGDINASPEEILKRVKQRFNITLKKDVEFVYLQRRKYLEPRYYPYFTLLGQSLGSIVVGWEALWSHLPDVYIESMGFAFTIPLFSYIGGCATACYIHYPTVSSDMLRRVSSRQINVTNKARVARSPFLSQAKIIYYRLFASLYSWCGSFTNTVMVNSTWTEDHINNIWRCCRTGQVATYRIYPPCDTVALKALPLAPDISKGGPIKIVSVGQFRPEKDHPLQIKAMYELRQLVTEAVWDRIKLVFVGSCRENEDHQRVKDMKDFTKHLSLEENIEFKVNVPYTQLKEELASSMIGLHAMWNEHFGIGIVECMAAGHIMVAHRSGGPQADIIEESEGSRNGFLATDEREYAEAIAAIIKLPVALRTKIREAARSSVDRFSTEEFEKGFLRTIEPLLSKK